MSGFFKQILAFFTLIATFLPSFLGLPSAYSAYKDEERYNPALGEIVIDQDMSLDRLTLTKDGGTDYFIIIAQDASLAEVNAAETLQDYLKQISGVEIEILTDDNEESEKEIIIGKTNRESVDTYTIDREALGLEGFNVFVFEGKLIIAGGGDRGTLYAVYTFLEQALACRWFTEDLIITPEIENISIRADINIKEVPYFEFRDLSWRPAYNTPFAVAQKINATFQRELTEENGGGIRAHGLGHSFTYQLPADTYFEDHPEYFALNEEGERHTSQPCLTNPDVLEIVTASVLAKLNEDPDVDFISVSQNDNPHYCRCENCRAVDEEEGSPAGSLIRFVNAVAEVIADEFPEVYVQTLIYDHTRKPTKITKPHENVIVHICSDDSCFSHPLEEGCLEDSFGNTFDSDLKGWRDLDTKIYVYDYTTNFSHFIAIHPNFKVLQKNMQYFAENKIKGVWSEGCGYMLYNGEFSHLKTYLLAKLMWDPYTDIDRHINEFMLAFYGEGYQNIRKFIDFTNDRGQLNHLIMWSSPAKALTLTSADLRKLDKWFDEAESLAKNDFELGNVQASRLQLRYYKNFKQKMEFSRFKNTKKAGEDLYEDLVRFGITDIGTGGHKKLKAKEEIDFTKPVRQWCIDK